MSAKKLTVMVAAFKCQETIKQSLISVLRNINDDDEILVGMDGPDADLRNEIISLRDRRIKLIQSDEHVGVSEIRNFILAEATSEFVAVVDSDDFALPNRFRSPIQALETSSSALVFGNARLRDATGRTRRTLAPRANVSDISRALLFANPLVHSTLTTRRSTLIECGPYEGAYGEDFLLYMKAIQLGVSLELIPEDLLIYSISENQLSQKMKSKNFKETNPGVPEALSNLRQAAFQTSNATTDRQIWELLCVANPALAIKTLGYKRWLRGAIRKIFV